MGRLDEAIQAANAADADARSAENNYWRHCETFARAELRRLILEWAQSFGLTITEPEITFSKERTEDDGHGPMTYETSVNATVTCEDVPFTAYAYVLDNDRQAQFRLDRIQGCVHLRTLADIGSVAKAHRERQKELAAFEANPPKKRRRSRIGPMGMGSKGWD
jgi:hypothetical protein